MRWAVPPSLGHDDLLNGLALGVQAGGAGGSVGGEGGGGGECGSIWRVRCFSSWQPFAPYRNGGVAQCSNATTYRKPPLEPAHCERGLPIHTGALKTVARSRNLSF